MGTWSHPPAGCTRRVAWCWVSGRLTTSSFSGCCMKWNRLASILMNYGLSWWLSWWSYTICIHLSSWERREKHSSDWMCDSIDGSFSPNLRHLTVLWCWETAGKAAGSVEKTTIVIVIETWVVVVVVVAVAFTSFLNRCMYKKVCQNMCIPYDSAVL